MVNCVQFQQNLLKFVTNNLVLTKILVTLASYS